MMGTGPIPPNSDSKIIRLGRPVVAPSRRREPVSSQIYEWPKGLRRLNFLLPLAAMASLFGGASLLMASSGSHEGLERATIGLILMVVCGGSLTVLFGLHVCFARQALLTRDSLIIRQSLRRDVILPYCDYQHTWVADCSNDQVVRLIRIGVDREGACTVWAAPTWFRLAIGEVARIQREEGWYPPEETSDDFFTHFNG